jgi:hypothetical protein
MCADSVVGRPRFCIVARSVISDLIPPSPEDGGEDKIRRMVHLSLSADEADKT